MLTVVKMENFQLRSFDIFPYFLSKHRLWVHVKNLKPHLSHTQGTYETIQVLLVGVPGVVSRGTPIFAPPTDWPISYDLK